MQKFGTSVNGCMRACKEEEDPIPSTAYAHYAVRGHVANFTANLFCFLARIIPYHGTAQLFTSEK
jgi:hypothetical protein